MLGLKLNHANKRGAWSYGMGEQLFPQKWVYLFMYMSSRSKPDIMQSIGNSSRKTWQHHRLQRKEHSLPGRGWSLNDFPEFKYWRRTKRYFSYLHSVPLCLCRIGNIYRIQKITDLMKLFQCIWKIHFKHRHDDVIKWKQFPRYWPFVRGIHRSPVNSPHKGQLRGALMFTLICAE